MVVKYLAAPSSNPGEHLVYPFPSVIVYQGSTKNIWPKANLAEKSYGIIDISLPLQTLKVGSPPSKP